MEGVVNPTVSLYNQYAFGHLTSLGQVLSLLAPVVFALAATIVAFYLIIAGVKFIVSEGDKASVSEAKKTITHTLIGLLALILLFAVMRFLPEFLGLGFRIF